MPDVLADLEAKLNEAKTALEPLVQAEATALAAAAVASKARLAQDLQVAAAAAARVAARVTLFGEEVLPKIEGEAASVVSKVEASPYGKAIVVGLVLLAVVGAGLASLHFWP